MRVDDRSGHQALCFVRSVAEHHSLVAGTLFFLGLSVYTLCDVGRLTVEVVQIAKICRCEILFGDRVADLFNYIAGNFFDINRRKIPGRNFAEIYHYIRPDGCFASDSRVGIFFDAGVQDSVGYLVGDFVGMSFGNGFRRKNVVMCDFFHFSFPVDSACVTPFQRNCRKGHRLK